nr:DNA-directed DNA polymerase [Tanacetum cinerariifolium]
MNLSVKHGIDSKIFFVPVPIMVFQELHQLDTVYNALNSKDQDSLNSAAGGNFLDKMPRECLSIIESKSKIHYLRNKPIVAKVSMNASTSGVSPDVAELKDMVKALLFDKKSQNQSPAPVKAVEESCVTCGGTHSYRNCPATDGNNYRDNIQEFVSQASAVNYNKGNTIYRPPMMSNQIRPPGFPPVPNNQNVQRNNQNRFIPNQNRGNNFNQGSVYQPPIFQPPAYQAPAYQALAPQTQGVSKEDFLAASTSSSGTLPSNTIANPKSDLKAITTRRGVSYDGPQIPPPSFSLPKVVENEPEVTKDTVNPTNNGNTEHVQPQAVQYESLVLISNPVTSPISEPAIAPVSALKHNPKASIPYPSRRNNERNHEKSNNQIEKFYQIFKDMSFEISFADALILMPKFTSTLKALIGNKKKLSEMARTTLNERCSAVLLKKLPEKLGDPGKFLIPCDFPCMAECLALADLELVDHSVSRPVGVAEDVYVKVGSFHFLADFVVVDFDVDPRVPLILGRSFLKTERALIDVFEEVDAFLAIEDEPTSSEFHQSYLDPEGDILFLEAFLNDDPSLPPPNQRNYMPEVCDDKLPVILAKDLSVEEKTALITVLKSHKRAIAWKLSDIKGINPEFCTHKILMEENFEPTVQHQRRVNPKIHDVIIQEVIKLLDVGLIYPISDSPWVSPVHCVPKKGGFTVVENEDNELIPTRLGISTTVFLTVFLVISKILIDPKDQEKTTFTCPYGAFAYRRMRFGLCNAPGMFQRKMLKRCENTNLCLNWEESHFMVKKVIVLGHKISKQGIEVNKAKVDVISKLPHPTTTKGIRSFLGHAGFYRHFIKDVSIIARPVTRLLEKDTPFIFSQECVDAFQTLKRKLTEAPILIAPD